MRDDYSILELAKKIQRAIVKKTFTSAQEVLEEANSHILFSVVCIHDVSDDDEGMATVTIMDMSGAHDEKVGKLLEFMKIKMDELWPDGKHPDRRKVQ